MMQCKFSLPGLHRFPINKLGNFTSCLEWMIITFILTTNWLQSDLYQAATFHWASTFQSPDLFNIWPPLSGHFPKSQVICLFYIWPLLSGHPPLSGHFPKSWFICFFYIQPLLSSPLFSSHFSKSRGWLLNRGRTAVAFIDTIRPDFLYSLVYDHFFQRSNVGGRNKNKMSQNEDIAWSNDCFFSP